MYHPKLSRQPSSTTKKFKFPLLRAAITVIFMKSWYQAKRQYCVTPTNGNGHIHEIFIKIIIKHKDEFYFLQHA